VFYIAEDIVGLLNFYWKQLVEDFYKDFGHFNGYKSAFYRFDGRRLVFQMEMDII
jgi:hypothetical protein